MGDWQLKDFLDLGSNGLLTLFLWQVWKRLNDVTDVLIENARQASAERQVIAKVAGLSTKDLSDEALAVRNQMNGR